MLYLRSNRMLNSKYEWVCASIVRIGIIDIRYYYTFRVLSSGGGGRGGRGASTSNKIQSSVKINLEKA